MNTNQTYASFLHRLMAAIINMLIPALISAFIIYVWLGQEKLIALMLEDISAISSKELIVNYALPIILTIFLWLQFAGTPGKLLANCEIVNAATFGSKRSKALPRQNQQNLHDSGKR